MLQHCKTNCTVHPQTVLFLVAEIPKPLPQPSAAHGVLVHLSHTRWRGDRHQTEKIFSCLSFPLLSSHLPHSPFHLYPAPIPSLSRRPLRCSTPLWCGPASRDFPNVALPVERWVMFYWLLLSRYCDLNLQSERERRECMISQAPYHTTKCGRHSVMLLKWRHLARRWYR